MLDNYPTPPNALGYDIAVKDSDAIRTAPPIPLYKDGKPVWFEVAGDDLTIDLVAIPVSPPSWSFFNAIQDVSEASLPMRPGEDVAIVGFPFEQGVEVSAAVWKRAMVASEPGLMAFNKPQILLDTPGRPGMSGAPVYLTGLDGLVRNASTNPSFKWKPISEQEDGALAFVGVYIGAYGNRELERMNLGRMIASSFLYYMLDTNQRKPGQNPFPPTVMEFSVEVYPWPV